MYTFVNLFFMDPDPVCCLRLDLDPVQTGPDAQQ
jgi:hypothetical protein